MKNILLFALAVLLFTSTVANSFSITNVPKKTTANYKKGRLWVRLKPNVSPNEVLSDYTIAERILLPHQSILFDQYLYSVTKEFTTKRAEIIRAEEPLLRTYIIEWKDERSNDEVMNALYATKQVESIAFDYIPKRQSTSNLPNDPMMSQQGYLDIMKVIGAWGVYEGSPEIVVAVIDDGVAQDHPDLKDNIAINNAEIPNNGLDDDGNGYIDDYNGYNFAANFEPSKEWGNTFNSNNHGQNVVGIVSATPNNGIGIAGVGNKSRFFPLKVFTLNTDEEFFGYQALVYAALRGFKVANCSWGVGGNRSEIFQSIINFCIARNLAIVVAAGNESSFTELVYPAAYFGVLGVGETDVFDAVTVTSSTGPNLGVMAPGYNSYSTSNSGYSANNNGTSFASPMVAGVVALIRGKYPELSALEALEHARNSVDDISDKNQFDAAYIGGRINALKAVSNPPLAQPGIRPIAEPVYKNNNGDVLYNFNSGDTISMYLPVKNYLGAGSSIQCSLSIPNDFLGNISLTNPIVTINQIGRNEESELGPFKFILNNKMDELLLFRIDFDDSKGYKNFTHSLFINQKPFQIIQNDSISYSIFENGRLGYETIAGEKFGVGFGVKPYESILSSGGILYTSGISSDVETTAYSLAHSEEPLYQFQIAKSIKSGNNAVSVLRKNGVEFEITAEPFTQTSTITRHKVLVRNTTDSVIVNPSIGYYADWDLGRAGKNNSVSLYPEAFSGVPNQNYAIKVNRTNSESVIGMTMSSKETNVSFSATGGRWLPLTASDVYPMLRGGVNIDGSFNGDAAASIGITFDDDLAPGQEKECFVCMGLSYNEESLTQKLRECMNATFVSVQEQPNETTFQVYPNPAKNNITISVPTSGQLIVRNLTGKEVLSMNIENLTSFTTNSLPNGMYIFEFVSHNSGRQLTFVSITR